MAIRISLARWRFRYSTWVSGEVTAIWEPAVNLWTASFAISTNPITLSKRLTCSSVERKGEHEETNEQSAFVGLATAFARNSLKFLVGIATWTSSPLVSTEGTRVAEESSSCASPSKL
jgi:hypothetical protein